MNHFSACVTCSRRPCHDRQPGNDDHHASAAPANLAHHSECDLIASPAPYPLPSALSSPSPLFFSIEQSRPSSSSCACRPHAPTTSHHPQIATTCTFLASPRTSAVPPRARPSPTLIGIEAAQPATMEAPTDAPGAHRSPPFGHFSGDSSPL